MTARVEASRRRAGFTLVEMLVALVLASSVLVLGAALTRSVLEMERSQGERAGLAATLRAGAGYLVNELESLGADSISGVDVDSAVPAGFGYRAQRGLKVSCHVAVDTVVVHADSAMDWAARQPVAGRDSLLLYVVGDSTTAGNAWVPLAILGVQSGVCPDGSAGTALETVLDSSAIASRGSPGRTAVRIFESVAVRAYFSAQGWQLGLEGRSAGAGIQPLAGPIAPGGFRLLGLDSSGSAIGVGPGVTAIRALLMGITSRQLATGLGARSSGTTDSLLFDVTLRNRE